MKMLVFGGSGRTGQVVCQAAAAAGWQVSAPAHAECDLEDAAAVLARVKATFPDNFELDGVSVDRWDAEGWWFNVRMSNTEPLVRLNLEAKTPDLMATKRDEMLALIRS